MANEEHLGECGLGSCKAKWLGRFASGPLFIYCYSATSVITSSLSTYSVSQVTTIEKQFGLTSTKTGYVMACNVIVYSVFILIASYMASRVHILQYLSLWAALFGVARIMCSLPHFVYTPSIHQRYSWYHDSMNSTVLCSSRYVL